MCSTSSPSSSARGVGSIRPPLRMKSSSLKRWRSLDSALLIAGWVALSASEGPPWIGATAPGLRAAGAGASPLLRTALAFYLRDAAWADLMRLALFCALAAAVLWVGGGHAQNQWPQRARAALLVLVAFVSAFNFNAILSAIPRETVASRLLSQPDAVPLPIPAVIAARFQKAERWAITAPYTRLNAAMPAGISICNGYDPIASQRAFEFAAAVEGATPAMAARLPFWSGVWPVRHQDPLLRVLGVSHTLFQGPFDPRFVAPGLGLEPIARADGWSLLRHHWKAFPEGAWPRLGLTRNLISAPGGEMAALGVVASQAQSPLAWPAILEVPAPLAPGRLVAGERVLDWSETPDSLAATVSAARPALLLDSDTLAPGWKAWINGKPAPILRANWLFRAVVVPQGRSRVAFVYDSQTLRFALFLGLGAAAILTAGWGFSASKAGPGTPRPPAATSR